MKNYPIIYLNGKKFMTLTGANNEYIKILKGAKDTDNESTIRIKIKQDDKMPGLGSREFELVISESSYPNLFIEMMNYMEMVYLHDCFKGVDADKVIKKLRDKQDELEYWYIEYILENQIDNNLNELLNNPIDYASTNYLAPHEIAYMIFQCEQWDKEHGFDSEFSYDEMDTDYLENYYTDRFNIDYHEENINRYINKYASDKIISSKLKRNLDVYSKLKKYQKKGVQELVYKVKKLLIFVLCLLSLFITGYSGSFGN